MEILRLKFFLGLDGLDLFMSEGIFPPVLLLKTFWHGDLFLRSKRGLPVGVNNWSELCVTPGLIPPIIDGTDEVEAEAILCATVNLVASDWLTRPFHCWEDVASADILSMRLTGRSR